MKKLLLIIGLFISLCGYSQYYVSNFGNAIVIKINADTLQVMQKEGLTVRTLNPPTVQFVRNNRRIIEFSYTSVTSPVVTSAESFVSIVGGWIASAGSLSLDSIYFSGGDTLFAIGYNSDTLFLNNDTILFPTYSNEYLTISGDTVDDLRLNSIKNDNGLAITTIAGVNRFLVNSAGNLRGAITTTTIGDANGNIGIGMLNPTIGGNRNYFIGTGIPPTLTGVANLVISNNGGQLLTSGTSNIVLGASAGVALTTGTGNVLQGGQAGQSVSTGLDNFALGRLTLNAVTTLSDNVGVGAVVLRRTTGANNTSVGAYSGSDIVGNNNVFIGTRAGQGAVSTGAYTTGIDGNTIIGYLAGQMMAVNSQNNVIIGINAGRNISSSNKFIVGNKVVTNPADEYIYGDFLTEELLLNSSVTSKNGYKSSIVKTVSNNTATNIFSIPMVASATKGFTATYTISAVNADTLQHETGVMLFSGLNNAGTLDYSFTTLGSTQPTAMLGTLAKILTATLAANVLTITIEVQSSIVTTSVVVRMTPDVHCASNITKL
jgi:hypothetical protein